jgi:hypothetical protein
MKIFDMITLYRVFLKTYVARKDTIWGPFWTLLGVFRNLESGKLTILVIVFL